MPSGASQYVKIFNIYPNRFFERSAIDVRYLLVCPFPALTSSSEMVGSSLNIIFWNILCVLISFF